MCFPDDFKYNVDVGAIAFIARCVPAVDALSRRVKTADLSSDAVADGRPCTGCAELRDELLTIAAAPPSPAKEFGARAAALMLYGMFPGLWATDDDWMAFTTELTEDIMGAVERPVPSAKKSKVVLTAKSPIELVTKWCL